MDEKVSKKMLSRCEGECGLDPCKETADVLEDSELRWDEIRWKIVIVDEKTVNADFKGESSR